MRLPGSPGPSRDACGVRAMTLIEVLVTIVLLGLLASVGTGALLGVASAGERARAVATVRRSDAMARALARAERPVELRTADGGTSIETWLVSDADGGESPRPEWRTALPAGSRVSIHGAGNGMDLLTLGIDSTGRSADVTYLVTTPAGDVTLDVAGRTGQLVERREASR
jgi:prepilin-type N-terminal cleavage/methylation domain-containing protein